MNKGREFWVDPEPDGDDGYVQCFQALSRHPQQGPLQWQASLIHVIEYQAYKKVLESLKALVNSQVVKQAEFIGYSEAYLIALETLKELGEHE